MSMYNQLSDSELLLKGLLSRVGCMSVNQVCYIFYKVYNLSIGVAMGAMHRAEARGYARYDDTGDYIIAINGSKNQGNGLNKKTVMAMGIAVEMCEREEDFMSIYRPSAGEHLRFLANNKAYGVYVCENDGLGSIIFYQNMYTDFVKRIEKSSHNHIKEEQLFDAHSRLIITYPPAIAREGKVDKMLDAVDALGLTMPHSIAMITTEDLSERIRFNLYSAE